MKSDGAAYGGQIFSRGAIYLLLQNRLYRGEITHKGSVYPGKRPAIIEQLLWDEVQAVLANKSDRANIRRAGQTSQLIRRHSVRCRLAAAAKPGSLPAAIASMICASPHWRRGFGLGELDFWSIASWVWPSRIGAAIDLDQGRHAVLVDEEMMQRPFGRSTRFAGDRLLAVHQDEAAGIGAVDLVLGEQRWKLGQERLEVVFRGESLGLHGHEGVRPGQCEYPPAPAFMTSPLISLLAPGYANYELAASSAVDGWIALLALEVQGEERSCGEKEGRQSMIAVG